jgi:hypothetical protein
MRRPGVVYPYMLLRETIARYGAFSLYEERSV